MADNQESAKYDLNRLLASTNIAEELSDELLQEIGSTVVKEYDIDEQSRHNWLKQNEQWMKLALQVKEKKTFPWPDAANVKYPLITTAAIQFSATAYPALVKNPSMVKAKVTGKDSNGELHESARRISTHMSYQVLEQMDEWEEDMDKLTTIVPITGCVFKKSYYSSSKQRNVSELVYARDLCIDYYASSLETAQRKTHILELTNNDIRERVVRGTYREVDLDYTADSAQLHARRIIQDKVNKTQEPDQNKNKPKIVLEQHRYWDLDDDGYEEPYIVTVDYYTKQVLRITANYDYDGIESTEQGEIIKITPVEYFTKFDFIPNPDGGIYGVGFGILLGSLNETANTLINMLLDSGTLNNMQSGFISRGLRLKNGKKRLKPGEWASVNSAGIDLKQGIYPLPTKEPSTVLFSLLGTILTSGEKLGSIVDILSGENPGQNQKATTSLILVEQGMKVFTAIHKRLYKALWNEFQKLYRLNSIYLDEEEYYAVLGTEETDNVFLKDYQSGTMNVRPAADPNIATEMQQIMKAQAALEMVQTGEVNKRVAVRRVLEATDQPNIDELMDVGQPQPSIDQLTYELDVRKQDFLEQQAEIEDVETAAKSVLALAKAEKEAVTSSLDELTARLDGLDKLADILTKLNPQETPKQEVT